MTTKKVKVTIHDKGLKRYVSIAKNSFIIGRALDVDVPVPFDYISRQQVHVTIEREAVWVEDLGSSNGTWIEGRRLPTKERTRLMPGQIMVLGQKTTTEIQIDVEAQTQVMEMDSFSAGLSAQEDEVVSAVAEEIRHEDSVVQETPVEALKLKEIQKEVQRQVHRDVVQKEVLKAHVEAQVSEEHQYKKVANGSDVYSEPKKKLAIVEPVIEAKVAEKKIDVEKNVFDQIKHLMNLEAQEIRNVAVEDSIQIRAKANEEAYNTRHKANEDAQNTRQKANLESLAVIEKAKAEAAAKLKETELVISQKLETLRQIETEKRQNVDTMTAVHLELVSNVEELRAARNEHQETLIQLKKDIEAEQDAIQSERAKFSEERFQLLEERNKLEDAHKELELEERRVRAQIEIDILEAKGKVSAMQAEVDKAQNLKDILGPEIQALQLQKEQFLADINTSHSEIQKLEENISQLNRDSDEATAALNAIYEKQAQTNNDIEVSKQNIARLEQIVDTRDEESRATLASAKVEGEKKIAQAQIEAHHIVLNAKEKADSVTAQADKDLNDLLSHQKQIKAEILTVQEEITQKLKDAEYDNTQIIKAGRKEADEIINSARRESSVIMEEAEVYADKKKVDSDKVLHAARKESLVIKDNADRYAEDKKKESEILLQNARNLATTVKDESLAYAELKKSESDKLLAQANSEYAKIKLDAKAYGEEKKKEADVMLEQLKMEVTSRKKESVQALAATEEKKKSIEAEIVNLQAVREKRLEETNNQIKNMMETAQKEAHELKTRLEASIHQEIKRIKTENDTLAADHSTKVKAQLAKLDAEYKEAKQKQEASLLEYRQLEMSEIKKMTRRAEEEIKTARTEKARSVATNVYAMIASEMYKARNKVMDEAFIEPFAKELKEMVADIMLDKLDPNSSKLQALLKTTEDARGKEKAFWKRLMFGGGALVFGILLVSVFPGLLSTPKNMLVAAFTEKGENQADAYAQKKVEEAKQRMTFTPDTTPEYKIEYVDNILYTTDYEAKKLNEAFHDKWILELNDWFINDLDVKDTTIIKFVSLETTLLRDLAKLRTQVDPAKPELKIEEMRAREKEFKEKLGAIFDDLGKVPRYYEFSQKFWNDFHHPRKPSTQAE